MEKLNLVGDTAVLDEILYRKIGPNPPLNPSPYSILDNGDFLHYHHVIEIGICIEGEGVCMIDGVSYPYQTGDAEVVFPMQKHISVSSGPKFSLWKWFFVDPREFLSHNEDCDYEGMYRHRIGVSGIFGVTRFPAIADAVRRFIEAMNSTDPFERQEKNLLLLRLLLIEMASASRDFPKYELDIPSRDENLYRCIGDMENAIKSGEIPPVRRFADKIGYSETYFRSWFRSKVGIGPKQYLLTLAVREAQKMLIGSDLGIEEIAARSGFGDASGLYRSFLALRGISPSEFRKRSRIGNR